MHVLHRKQPETCLMRLGVPRLFFLEVEVFIPAANHRGFLIVEGSFVGHRLNDGNQLAFIFLSLLKVMLQQSHPFHQRFQLVWLVVVASGMRLAFLKVAFLKLRLDYTAQTFHFLIDIDEKLSDAVDKSLERCPHIFLKLQDDCWFLVGRPQEGSLEDVVRYRYQLLVLSIEVVDLRKDVLVL